MFTKSNNQFQNDESGIFANFLTNQIGFNEENNCAKKQTKLVKLVLIGHKIRENWDLKFRNWLLDPVNKIKQNTKKSTWIMVKW